MILWVHEIGLGSQAKRQILSTSTNKENLTAIGVHLYRHNFPTGNIRVDLYDAAGTTLLASSDEVAISSIDLDTPTGDAFYHGMIRFDLNYYLAENTQYQIEVLGTGGYSFAESAYVGVVNSFDHDVYGDDYSPGDGSSSAYHLELFTLQKETRS